MVCAKKASTGGHNLSIKFSISLFYGRHSHRLFFLFFSSSSSSSAASCFQLDANYFQHITLQWWNYGCMAMRKMSSLYEQIDLLRTNFITLDGSIFRFNDLILHFRNRNGRMLETQHSPLCLSRHTPVCALRCALYHR